MSSKSKTGAPRGKSKREVFEEWMKGDHILVQLDSRRPGVDVPQHLLDNPALTLKLSYLFQGKTAHDDQAIRSFLRFSGNYYECIIPWPAIWGMTSSESQNMVWPEDVPKEIVMQFAKAKVKEFGEKLFGKAKDDQNETPAPEPVAAASTESLESAPAAEERKKGGHLKRIK